jgi:uncharacterized protein (TIGR02246 family)
MKSKPATLVDQARQWADHYGAFAHGPESAALSAPLRVRGAWDSNDATGVADAFTDNGSMLLGDTQLRGAEEIRTYLAEAFAGGLAGSRFQDTPADVFFLSSGTALIISTGGIVAADEQQLPPGRAQRITWVVVRMSGEWKLLSYQSSPIKS